MKSRILLYTFHISMLPAGGAFMILVMRDDRTAVDVIVFLVCLLQAAVIMNCKKVMQLFIAPDTEVLQEMNIRYVPIAYEPGRFQIDTKISSAAIWLTLLAPICTRLAISFPETVTVAVAGTAGYSIPMPNFTLLIISICGLLLGLLAFPFWFEMARASAIYAEGSDKKRYLMMGFADSLDECDGFKKYLKACRNH